MAHGRPFPLGTWSVGVVLGAWGAIHIWTPVDAALVFVAAASGAGLVWLVWLQPRWHSRTGLMALVFLAGFIVSSACAHLRALDRLEHRLKASSPVVDVVLDVQIDEMPVLRPDGVRLRVRRIGPIGTGPASALRRLQVAWYGTTEHPVPTGMQAGQTWRLPLRLKPPHGPLNPAGYDVEQWLFQHDIGATGSVRWQGMGGAQLLRGAEGYPVERLRQSFRDRLFGHLGNGPAAGVLAALAVGDQASIDRDDWAVFRRTGVAHLVAISGVHVTLFAWLVGAAAGRLWRLHAPCLLLFPAGTVGRWSGVAAAVSYALLAGWGVPAQRTVWMLLVWALMAQRGGRWSWPRVLAVAAAVIGLVDPWAIAEPGFWLSFVAVAVLMLDDPEGATSMPLAPFARADAVGSGQAWWARQRATALAAARVQIRITAGLAPLSLAFFQQISWVGLAANLIAIPTVTLLVMPLSLLGIAWPGFWTLGSSAVEALMWVLERLAALPAAAWQSALAPGWLVLLGLCGGILLVLPVSRGWRVLGLPLVAALALPPREGPAPGHFELWAFDIGQGNAVLVRTQAHTLLFDTGPKYWREGDAGERIVAPQLRALGVSNLDVMLLSHRDSDHVGGAASLLKEVGVQRVMSTLEPEHPLRVQAPHQPCAAGVSWTWDGVHFEVLRPSLASLENAHASLQGRLGLLGTGASGGGRANALSCVLAVSDARQRVLLTGDIELPQEEALLVGHGVTLRADVLMVPHHGSKTSSSRAFVAAVRPRIAFVQAGFLNRFGHPLAVVEGRYRDVGAQIIRSDRCGAWHWNSASGQGSCERDQRRRVWRAP